MTIHRNQLKSYAPQARKGFIEAVAARAAKFGITTDKKGTPIIASMEEQGDVVLIEGQAYPRQVANQRRDLEKRVRSHGYVQAMEEIAYTWFNRFMAIRYMELHGYLDHGFRVLSHPSGGVNPEILEHAQHVELAGLDREKAVDLVLDGTKDEELYRMLLVAQCNALHAAMPFLFEKIDDETELLLPDHLLRSDSLIRDLVNDIDEGNWQEIEVIGWLYQFYISEKKDEVFGRKKAVPTIDIPAATQLFTPNWIVKYMVQNSLGHQWVSANPNSSLKSNMQYYIEPAEQTEEIEKQLKGAVKTDLNPEELTLLDPAVGSGHILVEAYNLLKEIYLERGYRLREIPRLILEKNLYGLDIDVRAAQMAGFALLMKARADDRRILDPENPPILNILAFTSSVGVNLNEIVNQLVPNCRYEMIASNELPGLETQPMLAVDQKTEVNEGVLNTLINIYKDAKTFGSLISIPENLQHALPFLEKLIEETPDGDMVQKQLWKSAVSTIRPLIQQTKILHKKYNIVVGNPPYMGSKGMPPKLKDFAKSYFKDFKFDFYSMFIKRSYDFLIEHGSLSLITIQGWMYAGSAKEMRKFLINNLHINNLVHIGYNSFPELNSKYAVATAFSLQKSKIPGSRSNFLDLNSSGKTVDKEAVFFERVNSEYNHVIPVNHFTALPDSPFAYNFSNKLFSLFKEQQAYGQLGTAKSGLQTGDNDRFLRYWYEISSNDLNKLEGKWFLHAKGGDYRKWYGNIEYCVNWENGGNEIISHKSSRPQNRDYYFKPGITWSHTGLYFGARKLDNGIIFNVEAPTFFSEQNQNEVIAALNCKVTREIFQNVYQSLHFLAGDVEKLPYLTVPNHYKETIRNNVEKCVEISQRDWDSFETSIDFSTSPLLSNTCHSFTVEQAFNKWKQCCDRRFTSLKQAEEENNSIFIDAYGLSNEFSANIEDNEISLVCAEAESDIKRLISYSIGCMMGRFSLDEKGLVYANANNEGFDHSRYGNFPADDDGIVPISENEDLAFDDDAAIRFQEFLKEAWSEDTLSENLKFVAESIGAKKSETAMDAIRRYLSKDFFKDHLKTYKKRPIYWLFSSGKLKAFECLVYLHRYNEGTLARMRMEYVTPLQSRMANRIETLGEDIKTASSAEAKRKQKEKDKLTKQLEELRKFDEELRHLADQRITIDLDDGVKVNYGKFGNLLAEKKAITGKK
jgi:Eco57I restriction-modification methylase